MHQASAAPGQPRSFPIQSILLIALFALAAMLSLRGQQPPAPQGLEAPAESFSALRARDALERILGDGRPHPTGSAANAEVRDRVIAEFAKPDLMAQAQRRFVCGTAICATVENIVVRLPGASREDAVLLSAHYDSVAAGPGASDDGAGVAALIEVARALKSGPTLPRDVWFLVNDGEEIDLLGAEAFVREPEFSSIASVVNLEARGTDGASVLIETQPGNAAIIAAVGEALGKPAGTSLDYEIYKTLPNDTDFTVYRREGRTGTSFALAQGAARYHTPLDNLDHLDPGSLQHHGDNLLSMARALANASNDLGDQRDAVYFNVFGGSLASWPVTWNPVLLGLGLLGGLVLVVRLVRADEVRPLRLVVAGVVALLLLVLAGILAAAMHAGLSALGALPADWTAQESVLIAAFVGLAVAFLTLLAAPMARRFGSPVVALIGLLPFALIATAAVLAMPGASHVGLFPLMVGVVAGNLWPKRPALWSGLAALSAVMLWFPYVVYAYVVAGQSALPVASVLMALALLPLLTAVAGLGRAANWTGVAALLITVGLAALAVLRPAFDANVPRPVNLVYVGSEQGARVLVNPFADLPAGFLQDNGFEAMAAQALPWSRYEMHAGQSGPALAPPTVEIVEDRIDGDRRHLGLRLRSARGATEGGLRLPGSVDLVSVRVNGQALLAPRHGALPPAPFRGIGVIGLAGEGVLIEFEAAVGEAVELYAVDSTPGIPEGLVDVVTARDRIGVPIHNGDTSLSWLRVEIPASPSP